MNRRTLLYSLFVAPFLRYLPAPDLGIAGCRIHGYAAGDGIRWFTIGPGCDYPTLRAWEAARAPEQTP